MKEIRKLKALNACSDAIEYLQTQPDYQTAWQNCERGDWQLWLLQKKLDLEDEAQLRLLTLAKARCAKLVVHLMQDRRSRKAVEVAEAFGNGNASRPELADAAADAADTAAYAADDAAYAAAQAADAYAAAAYAADAAYTAARENILQQCANIVREVFPQAPEL